MKQFITQPLNIATGTVEEKRNEILSSFEKTWALDELLYTQLKSDDVFYHRGDPLRHVLLFYFGHTAVFFINKLFLAKLIEERVNPAFESIFAIGVDEMSWDDLNDKHYNWPTVDEVRAYRNEVKSIVVNLIKTLPLSLPISWNDPFWILLMGMEHERIHIETSSVLIRQLPLNEVIPAQFGTICPNKGNAEKNSLIDVKATEIQLGKPLNHVYYGWDNEYGLLTEKVADFRASKFLVSNAEFLEFVENEGYQTRKYWTEEGWNWCTYKEATMPLFWRKTGEKFLLRLVAEEIDMPWNWPVEVNYLEAKAFCNWKSEKEKQSYRLPGEAEWHALLQASGVTDSNSWEKINGNINLEYFCSPCPVNTFITGDFGDLAGNVWQWTESPISGFPGFKVHAMYDDFSTPTFDGKHNLIKGGSWISTGNEASYHARYAFRRHFYQHAGFRYVQSETAVNNEIIEYETDVEIANSCENNWGDVFGSNVDFHKNLAKLIQDFCQLNDKNVLDLNADTGRLAYELAPQCAKITAIDFSARFIRMPILMQQNGYMRYAVKDEGELVFYREVVADKEILAKILFMQDNANNLKPIYSGYDLIILPCLLEELNCPISFLNEIHERLNAGGTLVIASGYDWERGGIKRPYWPGGFKRDGEPVSSFVGISNILESKFELLQKPAKILKQNRKSSTQTDTEAIEVSIWKLKL